SPSHLRYGGFRAPTQRSPDSPARRGSSKFQRRYKDRYKNYRVTASL
ncbi:uncharacterized protein METZ01_LOCUS311504, partial [marine metagenome]